MDRAEPRPSTADSVEPVCVRKKSPAFGTESLKSNASRDLTLGFKDGRPALPKCESLRSDKSRDASWMFKDGRRDPLRCESVSTWSIDVGVEFKDGGPSASRESSSEQTELENIFAELEQDILTFVKDQLQHFHRLLTSDQSESTSESTSESEEQWSSCEAALNITVDFLTRMKRQDLAECLKIKSSLGVCRNDLKRALQSRFSHVFEGVAKAGDSAPLQQIYTELYVTEGGASELHEEHEIRLIETASRKPAQTLVTCEELIKGPAHKRRPIRAERGGEGWVRTMLTKGVAGVGKTVLTQKVSLDWAEGAAHQHVPLLFPFTFRQINVLKDRCFSLMELIYHFFSQTRRLHSFGDLQVLFIFDGLDECRLPLDFTGTRVLTEPTESASVEELLVNLIRGTLLPSALLWITTRPTAANQIPAECVSRVTEVRGFTDEQKEQYFMKRFRDEQQATAVISHIKNIRCLYIMSYIPIFCWILSNVLKKNAFEQLPHTLTQMYIHLLVVQAKVKNIKFHDRSETDPHWTLETKEMVKSLGKLAFEQLQKRHLIFYESDLSECGLDAEKATRYSGVFTQILKEEGGLYQDKVYCFIHLSVQEFLAALHVHQTFFSSGENLLSTNKSTKSDQAFYRSAVNQAVQSPNGHLDLFLRFLLGLSLSTNQKLLKGLVKKTRSSSFTNEETMKYIKKKLNEGPSPEKSLNLLHCLNELNDGSLMEEIQRDIRTGGLSDKDMSRAEWSALSFLLLSSDLDHFDLRRYCSSETALVGLLLVIKASTKATLSGCGLSRLSCGSLASVLPSSSLMELDLSNNDLGDRGVELLCEGLKSAPCRLHRLSLSGCLVAERGGASLASALSSAHSNMRALDLSYNHPGVSADLLKALQAPHGALDSLRLDPCGEQWMVPGLRKYSCEFSLDPNTAQRFLLLSEDRRSVAHVTTEQEYPLHKDRFSDWHRQVLSCSGLRGRCYWEVEWSGEVDIALSYRSIRRRGLRQECVFGENAVSWRLRIFNGRYSVCHDQSETLISVSGSRSGREAVLLDSEAGLLSFYHVVSDGELFHLHTFNSRFTEPLFPGFGLWSDRDYVSVLDLRRAPPGGLT